MKKITIQQIADHAGLSKYAVSRALSGKTGVSDLTRHKVRELADELGYERSVSRGQSNIVVVCEDEYLINSELNQRILDGIRNESYRLGIDIVELQTTGARQLSDALPSASGLIFIGVNRTDILEQAYASSVPKVKIGNNDPLEQSDIVRGSNFETGYTIGRQLLDHHHRHLVFVRGRRDFRGRQGRYVGFLAASMEEPEARVSELKWTQADELNTHLESLLSGPDRATSFFCAHDGLAVTIVSELLARNLKIPRDVSVVGFGDYVTARHVRPTLTTVCVQGDKMGHEAVKLLRARIDSKQAADYPIHIEIPDKIVYRQSMGPRPR